MPFNLLKKMYYEGFEYNTQLVDIPVGKKLKVANFSYNWDPEENFDSSIQIPNLWFILTYKKIDISYLIKGKETIWSFDHPSLSSNSASLPGSNPDYMGVMYLARNSNDLMLEVVLNSPGTTVLVPDQNSPIYINRGGKALYTLILQGFASLFRKVALAC